MSMLITCFLASVVFAVLGLAAGWVLHSQVETSTQSSGNSESDLAKDLVASVHCLARRVAADVGAHSDSINRVDAQLGKCRVSSGTTVHQLVAELLAANQEVQEKLAKTEAKLDDLNKQVEAKSSEARMDALTGLANRRAFEELAGRQMDRFRASNNAFAFMIVDIDKFKRVNDEHGHPCGDEVLRGVAQILTENLRGRDIVTRYGGEEFAILLPDTSIGDARRAADQLRDAVEHAYFRVDGKSLSVTVSIGVAEVVPFEELPSLIKRADRAMYAAKHAGRNRVYWHDGTLAHPVQLTSLVVDRAQPSAAPAPVKLPQHGSQSSPPDTPEQPVGPRLFAQEADNDTSATSFVDESLESADLIAPDIQVLLPEDVDAAVLKNIGNKTMFCQDIRRRIAEWNRGGPVFSVILAGIDQYDELIRNHGDAAARVMFGAVAQSTDAGIGDMDVIALYNNSTIGLVLPRSPLKNAVCVGERLMRAIDRTALLLDGQEIRFSLNFGVVEVREGDEMATLIERARAELVLCRTALGAS